MRLLKWEWRTCQSGLAYAGSSPVARQCGCDSGNNLLDSNGGKFSDPVVEDLK